MGKTWKVKIDENQRCAFGVTLTMLGHMQVGEWESAKICLKTIETYINDCLNGSKTK